MISFNEYLLIGARLHVCAKRQCSHLCLLTPEGAVCACPDGWDLIDHRICKGEIIPRPRSVLYRASPEEKWNKAQMNLRQTLLMLIDNFEEDYNEHYYVCINDQLIIKPLFADPRKSATAIPKSTTQMPPKVSPAGVVPWIPLMTNRSQSVPRSTSTQSPPLGTSSAAPDSSCNFLCMNGGTCTYSQEQNREYCM